jgi:hypothetical protein
MQTRSTRPAALVVVGTALALLGCWLAVIPQSASAADLIPLFSGGLRYVAVPNATLSATACGLVTGDFNGDGKRDVVSWSQSGLSVQLGNGDGTLRPAQVYPLDNLTPPPLSNACIVAADINGDGKLDVVTLADGCDYCQTNPTHRGVVVWLGKGDGTFQSPVGYDGIGEGHLTAIALADLNGDGKLDAVVAADQDAGSAGSTLTVLLGNGDGTFGAPTGFPTGPGNPFMFVLRDFNGDGKLDAVVTDVDQGALALMLGNGDGTFQAPATVPVTSGSGLGLGALAVGDFNKDGKLDLIVSTFDISGSSSIANVDFVQGNGDGTFQAPQVLFNATVTYSIFVGDFDGDGNADLAFNPADSPLLNSEYRAMALIVNGKGDGTFRAPQLVPAGLTITAADFNGDGKIDLVSTDSVEFNNQTVSVPTTSIALQPFPVVVGNGLQDSAGNLRTPDALAVGDFNGDGKLDFVAPEPKGALAYLNQGNGVFTTVASATPAFPAGTGAGQVAVADFNGDGKLDFAYADPGSHYVGVELGNGDGTFTLQPIQDSPEGYALVMADLNGDGKPDLIAPSIGAVQVMLGAGDGTFPIPTNQSQFYTAPTGNSPSNGLVVGDFNGDGKVDVAVAADRTHKTIQVLLGNGDGTLQTAISTPVLVGGVVTQGVQGFIAADFNGDGKLDLAMISDPDNLNDENVISVLLGNGDGTFHAPVQLPALPFGSAWLLKSGDFDGDGIVDLLVAGFDQGGPLVLLRGNGDGTFRDSEEYTTARPQYLAAGDFQGSGRLSLAVSNEDDRNVTVLLNRTAPLANPPPTVSISLSTVAITVGASSTLTWSSTNATSCTASGAWSGSQTVSGSAMQAPTTTGTNTYTLTCTGAGGGATGAAVLTVSAATPPAPTVTVAANPTALTVGASTTLTWSSTHASACTAGGAWIGTQAISGSTSETPTAAGTATYTLTCTGAGGTATGAAVVTVSAEPAPTVSIAASPTTLTVGASTTLTWSSTHATSCSASGAWSGAQAVSGTQSETPAQTGATTYTLTCSGDGGSATASATVEVNAVTVVGKLSGKVGGGGAMGWETLGLELLVLLRMQSRQRVRGILVRCAVLGAALLAAPSLLATSANAADLGWDVAHSYVGLRVGAGNYEPSTQTLDAAIFASGASVTIDRHQTVGSAYAGLPFFGPLALEVGFVDLGSYDVHVTTNGSNLSQAAKAVIDNLQPAGRGGTLGVGAAVDLGQWFAIEPHAGLLVAKSRQEVWTTQENYTRDRTDAGVAAGVELLLRPTHSISVGGGVDCFGAGVRCNVLVYSAQLEYHFGKSRP